MRAMPSLASMTVPTFVRLTPASNCSICVRRMEAISSARTGILVLRAESVVGLAPCGYQLLPQPLQAAPRRAIDQLVTDLQDRPTDNRRVDLRLELNGAAGLRRQPLAYGIALRVVEGDRGADSCADHAALLVEQFGKVRG